MLRRARYKGWDPARAGLYWYVGSSLHYQLTLKFSRSVIVYASMSYW